MHSRQTAAGDISTNIIKDHRLPAARACLDVYCVSGAAYFGGKLRLNPPVRLVGAQFRQ